MTEEQLKLLCVLAHPEDETLGFGGILARYAAEGVETSLLTATRGEKGWFGDPADYPGPEELGRIREAELRAATEVLSVHDIALLNYVDGELDQADLDELVAEVVAQIRRRRPDVIATFAHDGVYGHPDHIAICQATTAAVVAAADARFAGLSDLPSHRTSKLYYRSPSPDHIAAYEAAFGELKMSIDGVERTSPGWQDWSITTRVDTTAHWEQVWEAIQHHRSQLPGYQRLQSLPPERHAYLWGTQEFYRVFSFVNGGREPETDLFAGLRPRSAAAGA